MSLITGHIVGARDKPEEPPWFPDWTLEAACAEADPEVFFPPGWSRRSQNEAKKLCYDCPVRMECLTDNLEVPYGIFGGLNERERWRLRGKGGDPHKDGLGFFTHLYRNMVRDDKR